MNRAWTKPYTQLEIPRCAEVSSSTPVGKAFDDDELKVGTLSFSLPFNSEAFINCSNSSLSAVILTNRKQALLLYNNLQ